MIIANFVTNTHNDLNSNHVLHSIMVKIKQIFNLKRGVDFRENNLRKNFNNWLHLVSDKIRNKTFFDGDLIILIEGVNLFVEQNHGWENDLKFWLPRELPPRVKIILTIEEGSHNISYLQKIGCRFLQIESRDQTRLEILDSLHQRAAYVDPRFKQSVFDILREKVEQGQEGLTSGFIKSTPLLTQVYISCLVPSKSNHLISLSLHEESLIKQIFESEDSRKRVLASVAGIDTSQELIAFLFSFYQVRPNSRIKYSPRGRSSSGC